MLFPNIYYLSTTQSWQNWRDGTWSKSTCQSSFKHHQMDFRKKPLTICYDCVVVTYLVCFFSGWIHPSPYWTATTLRATQTKLTSFYPHGELPFFSLMREIFILLVPLLRDYITFCLLPRKFTEFFIHNLQKK